MRKWRLAMSAMMVASAAFAAPSPSASQLRADIARHGAKFVVDSLVERNMWDTVSARIAEGEPDLLALVPALASGTDAGPSEDLGIDLAFALPGHAAAVLRIADQKKWTDGGLIGIERVCGLPFIDGTEPKSYLRRAVRAVRSVEDPGLARKKQECLAQLTAASPGH